MISAQRPRKWVRYPRRCSILYVGTSRPPYLRRWRREEEGEGEKNRIGGLDVHDMIRQKEPMRSIRSCYTPTHIGKESGDLACSSAGSSATHLAIGCKTPRRGAVARKHVHLSKTSYTPNTRDGRRTGVWSRTDSECWDPGRPCATC